MSGKLSTGRVRQVYRFIEAHRGHWRHLGLLHRLVVRGGGSDEAPPIHPCFIRVHRSGPTDQAEEGGLRAR